MIFLSAQPDTQYFLWQLEIQLANFSGHGIAADSIQVLLSYDRQTGLNYKAKQFIIDHAHLACFFTYPDSRENKNYISSVRPHIIQQHFFVHRELSNEVVFYHDSDIVFTYELPDFEKLNRDDIWYFSDTRSYLSSHFIKSKHDIIFKEMCEVMGMEEGFIADNDVNAGGAQCLLKKVDHNFWAKVEESCNLLYELLEANKDRYKKIIASAGNVPEEDAGPVSSWCADMWAILWNSFQQARVKIDAELNFCWPHEPIENRDPFDDDFSFVPEDCSGYNYVKLLNRALSGQRYDLSDVTFLISVRIDSSDRLENVTTAVRYILENFRTHIILLEADSSSKMDGQQILDNEEVEYVFILDDKPFFHRQVYNNIMVKASKTDIIIKYDADIVMSPAQLYYAVLSVRYHDSQVCYPFDGRFISVSGELRKHFIKTLQISLLLKYLLLSDFSTPSFGGCVVLNKRAFEETGMDNTNFIGWGFEDQEIQKRSKILGLNIKREMGPLFHLEHHRGTHSYFYDFDELISSYKEYTKICGMRKPELLNYIEQWA